MRYVILSILIIGTCSTQYVPQQRSVSVGSPQASQPEVVDQIPAWYQMAGKPVNGRVNQIPQASPSYYERVEPTYEARRSEQPAFERPGIQTNQYANYPPTYQNRQPYENLNALTSGASLSNLQASRRYPNGPGGSGSDMPYDSALKRYHKLLLKRRQWTTKIARILASTTPKTLSTTASSTTTISTTTATTPSTTTKKMPKSLQSIYSTIIPKKREEVTEVSSTTSSPGTTKIIRITAKPKGRTFRPYGTRKGWRMWKKVTPLKVRPTTSGPTEATTTEPSTTTTDVISSTDSVQNVTENVEISTTEKPETTTVDTETPTTEGTTPSSTTTETTTTEKSMETYGSSSLSERRLSTIGPFRPIVVGHKWKPLRFKKPTDAASESTTTATTTVYNGPKGLRLLEYLLRHTQLFSKGLQTALDGPNTELLAAIKDVVAKFKASLDEAGIDQDVRLMGNQLKNTWQQLRTGLDRGMKAVRQSAETSVTHFNYGPNGSPQMITSPAQIPYHHQHHHPHYPTHGPMNEQLGRLFEKAVADAAEQKTHTAPNQSRQ